MRKTIAAFTLLIAASFALSAQTTVRGKVLDDSTKEAIPFAVVNIDGTYQSTFTDANGSFVFKNVEGDELKLQVRMIGYQDHQQWLRLPADTNITIVMRHGSHLENEIIVHATRTDENSGTVYTNVSKKEIEKGNFGQDLPYLLNSLPSVVTTSDAGAGFGYTGIRIRGSDASRINVTINGIPVNDAESQGTYWVDMPDITSSVENLQVQRGAGTSTNGAGSFGGSVNILTDGGIRSPFAEVMVSGGSFNTQRTTLKLGTGLLNDKFSFEGRMSKITSDGYIDRGNSSLSSWYLSGGYYGTRMTIKAITFSGKEKTYQSWYGVPQDSLKTNRTFNPAGMYYDTTGHLRYYDNETDNYQQDYYQLHFLLRGNEHWNFNWAFHATKGKGYYEEYRQGESLQAYGLDTVNTQTDLVRRLWLDNWFYGITYAATYTSFKNTALMIGGANNNYEGYHYNEVIWGTKLPLGTPPVYRYDQNYARKYDANNFVKLTQTLLNDHLVVYAGMQFRNVRYAFDGIDTLGNPLPQITFLSFINSNLGLTYRMNANHEFYASVSTANKEPNRDDFVNSTFNSRPKPEAMTDLEGGWRYKSQKLGANVNLYYMKYFNQLVLTGKVNDVGAYTRQNVENSFRRGLELIVGYNVCKQFNISANTTLSQNQILDFHEYIDDYDNGGQLENVYQQTDIAFSPSLIGALDLTWQTKCFAATLQGKYVGKQYLDNTSHADRVIDPYMNLNLNLSWIAIHATTEKPKCVDELRFSLLVNNLTNSMYSSNGYTYGYVYGGTYSLNNYYYPQAGINCLGMISVKFGPRPAKLTTNEVPVVPE